MTNTVTPASRAASRRALSKAALTCAAALAASAGLGVFGGSAAHAQHFEYSIDMVGDPALANTNGSRSFPAPFLINNVGMVVGNQAVTTSNDNGFIGTYSWFFDNSLIRIGLFDAEHTGNTGGSPPSGTPINTTIQNSSVLFLTDAATQNVTTDTGYVGGQSKRYQGGIAETGQSAWVYSAADDQTLRVGLIDSSTTGPSHTTSAGEQVSRLRGVNRFGTAAGESDRYLANTTPPTFGTSAWIQDYNSTATLIGLGITAGDTEHRTSTGRWDDTVVTINDLGDVVGTARRYSATDSNIGTSLWIRTSDGSTTKLGFIDSPEHQKTSDGTKASSFVAMNAQSTVVGHSDRYGSTSLLLGKTAWIQRRGEATPTRLGFITNTASDTFNSSTGTRSSTVLKLTDDNFAAGTSQRYNGTSLVGLAAWMFSDNNGVQRVGLTDSADHEGIIGGVSNKSSTVTHLARVELPSNQVTGVAAGTSLRYIGAPGVRTQSGQSAWRYWDGTATTDRFGLTDGEHTRADGTQSSSIPTTFNALNDQGDLVGHSTRYNGSSSAGQSAWFAAGGSLTSQRIGLFDSTTHQSTDSVGTQSTTVLFLNNEGEAAGKSQRYTVDTNSNPIPNGESGWFFDGTSTIPLVFSTSSSGQAQTDISFLSDTGVVLGTYTKFSGSTNVGTFAFLWDSTMTDNTGTSVDERFFELGNLVEGGLSANGWVTLNSVIKMSESGRIIGQGTLTSAAGGGTMPFVLTPVPEPAGAALLAATGLLMLPRRHRRRAN